MEIARLLAASGLIDFFNVVAGTLGTDADVAYTIPNMGHRYGAFLELAGGIRRATGLPVFQASRIPDLSTARWAVEQGFVDMVGMTRAHIADPHIVAKLKRGEEHRIRPCVGMGYCIDRIYQGKDALCIHNAATGREATMPHAVPATDGAAAQGGGGRRRRRRDGGGPGRASARPRGGAARGHRPAGRPDQSRGQGAWARGDRRHRRLARGRARDPGRRGAAEQLRRGRGRPRGAAGRGDRRHRRPARHELPGRRRGSGDQRLGRARAAMSSPPAACCSTTITAGTRGRRPRWRWRRRAWRSSW